MRDPFPVVSHDEWRARVEKELGGEEDASALVTHTLEDIPIQPLYSGEEPASDRTEGPDGSGYPGLWPYTRGPRAAPRGERPWRLCQLQDHPDPDTLRESIATDLSQGVDALWLRLDRAARLGLDGAAEEAPAHIGVEGATIYTAADLEAVLAEEELEGVTLILDAGGNTLPAAALVLAAAGERGCDFVFGADPLAALARDGELPGPLATLEEEMATLAAYCRQGLPGSRAVTVSTQPYHLAGAHTVQELAYALATGVHYLRRLDAAGIEPGAALDQIVFELAVGRHLFVEIAKLRAARQLWAMAGRACGLEAPSPAWIHATTSGRTLTRRDPWNNLLRVTTQVFAAIAGGADAITSASFDAALGQPADEARRWARHTQTILAEEAHLGRVLDPAGGSFHVEWLTGELARSAWPLFREIENRGGMARALESGLIAEQVEESWRRRSKRLAEGIDKITGVTEFAPAEEESLDRPERRKAAVVAEAAQRTHEQRSRRQASSFELPGTGVEWVEAAIEGAGRGATLGELGAGLERPAERTRMSAFLARRESEAFEDAS